MISELNQILTNPVFLTLFQEKFKKIGNIVKNIDFLKIMFFEHF